MRIRPATAADIPLIQAIAHAAWPVAHSGIISPAQIAYMLDRMYGTPALEEQSGPEGHRFLIAEQAGTPDADARRYIQEAFKQELGGLCRFVNTPLGSSFKQSLVRTILRGMALVGDRNKVIVIASSLEQALDLIGEKASTDTPSRQSLEAQIAELFSLQGIARSA